MIDSPSSIIRSVLPALRGVRILDVGTGDGGLAGFLVAQGAEVVGIDPNPEAIARARIQAPDCTFDLAEAEYLPYADASFDLVVFSNALHHVPVRRMAAAIDEASRVLRPNGFLIVIEPLAIGTAFQALKIVDDETVVRLAAQVALKGATLNGHLVFVRSVSYVRQETYQNAEVILERMIAVDPRRASAIDSRRPEVIAAICASAECSPNGELVLEQPIKADIMRKSDARKTKAMASLRPNA